MRHLEVYAQHELEDAASRLNGARDIAISARHLAERRTNIGVRVEISQVENVERGGAELDVGALLNGGPLHQADVEEAVPVRIEVAAPAERAGRRRTDVRLGEIEIGQRLPALLEGRQ